MLEMKSELRFSLIAFFISVNGFFSVAQTGDPVISAIKREVDRNLSELKIEELLSPFFISYSIVDQHRIQIKASFGAVTSSFETRERAGFPFVLVGSFNRNNLKYNPGYSPGLRQKISIENDPAVIGVSIWEDLDWEYKRAVKNFESKKGILSQTRLTLDEQNLPDYEQTSVISLILPPEKINIDHNYWENYARIVSEVAQKYPEIIKSEVTIELKNCMIYYYDTGGSQFVVPAVHCYIDFLAWVMTDDGEELVDGVSYHRSSTDRLPNLEIFVDDCENKISNLLKLRNAPLAEKVYSGPVLFKKESLINVIQMCFKDQLSSSSQFIHTGRRGGNDLEMKIGERLVSSNLTVKSLSGKKVYKGQILDGYFPVDGEGVVPDEELVIIENGVLKNLLSRRVPTLTNQQSNGHFRFYLNTRENHHRQIQPGVIQFTGCNMKLEDDMKKELIKVAREARLEYAYMVDEGFKKIYVDDGREEVIRGINLSNYNIDIFKRVLSISDEEFFYSTENLTALSTFIVPKSMLFEELDLIKDNQSNLSTSFLIPKPTK